MIKRTIENLLSDYKRKFPAIAIMGPRQSGKTTVSKLAFPDHTYVSLEEPNMREIALQEPKKFLENITKNQHGVILDEVQNTPELLSYIQGMIDAHERPGFFIITGSHNLLLNEAITQTLAGRVAILTLLPLSLEELPIKKNSVILEDFLFTGGYPRLYSGHLKPTEWFPGYIQTYLERDVRQIQHILDLSLFQRFLKLCAGRAGQILNIVSLANDCGISFATARGWLSLLEMSYIIFLLQPYYKNFSKRLIKSPKLYFYDTGLLCNLLDMKSSEELNFHYMRGNIMESMVVAEIQKIFFNRGIRPPLYFWRDNHGTEIDCIIDYGSQIIPIEIKAGISPNNNFFDNLKKWDVITDATSVYAKATPDEFFKKTRKYVVYGGDQEWDLTHGGVISWKDVPSVIKEIL